MCGIEVPPDKGCKPLAVKAECYGSARTLTADRLPHDNLRRGHARVGNRPLSSPTVIVCGRIGG